MRLCKHFICECLCFTCVCVRTFWFISEKALHSLPSLTTRGRPHHIKTASSGSYMEANQWHRVFNLKVIEYSILKFKHHHMCWFWIHLFENWNVSLFKCFFLSDPKIQGSEIQVAQIQTVKFRSRKFYSKKLYAKKTSFRNSNYYHSHTVNKA